MRKYWLPLLCLLLLVAGCDGGEETPAATPAEPETGGEVQELTLMTHDSFDASEDVIAEFEQAHNVRLVILPSGDAGTALNQAILAGDNPLADVFYGVDNSFLSRALEAGIFESYESPLLAEIPDEFELDPENRLLPVDYGDVCLNYDIAWFEENGLEPPDSLEALAEPDYRGLLVVENPATSSPGLSFLLATINRFGTEGDYTYLDYWRGLRENDVLVTNEWNEAYYGHFSVASDGDRPLVVSYATSPPAEVIFADPPREDAPSASVTAPGACFRQIEFAGVLAGTEQPELARALVDFLLGERFQEDIPLRMFVYPVNENADLPEEFVRFAQVAAEPATVPPEEIDANREAWIDAWTDVVLR